MEIAQKAELGQVWTPPNIAEKMVYRSISKLNKKPSIIVDPAVGPGIFIDKLIESNMIESDTILNCFDVDPTMVNLANNIYKKYGIKGKVVLKDFLQLKLPYKPDIIIMNPPYIRQEWISFEKKCLYKSVLSMYDKDLKVDGRSNIFIYFLLKAIYELKDGGILSAIVYDALSNTGYGKKTFEFLEAWADDLEIETIQTPFNNVLVDAEIIYVRKSKMPNKNNSLKTEKKDSKKTCKMEYLVNVRRGTALINSRLFMAKEEDPYYGYAKTFVKKKAKRYIVDENHNEKAYIFDENEIIPDFLVCWLREKANEIILSGSNIITLEKSINSNINWIIHKKHTAPIIVNYYLRDHPKHILNENLLPVADNFYLINPKDLEPKIAWVLLNTSHYKERLMSKARNQGNGLKKLQAYEYRETIVPDWRLFSKDSIDKIKLLVDDINDNYDVKYLKKVIFEAEVIVKKELQI